MEIFILWILCGIVAAMIGAKKGEGCGGFIVGVLLGPFGILIALFSKGNRKTCPHCRELIHRDATVCSHCQRDVVAKPAPAPVLAPVTPPPPQKKGVGFFSGCLIIFLVLFTVGAIISGIMQATRDASSSPSSITPSPSTPTATPQSPPDLSLTSVEEELLCKGAIAVLYHKPIDIIQVTKRDGDILYLSYVRQSDATTWRNKCRLQGRSILWGNDDGRWRTDPRDEKISFEIDRPEGSFTIRMSYPDGSGETKTFRLE